MSTDTFKPKHELSKRSKQLKHNLFIWSLKDHDLEGGLHLHSHNPITMSTLYRWIEIVLTHRPPEEWRLDPALVEKTPFELYPAKVDQPPYLNFFCYESIAVGDVIPRTSNEILQPGYLGIRAPAGSGTNQIRFPEVLDDECSFFAQEEERKTNNEEIDYRLSDPEFATDVLKRDNYSCAITGHTQEPLTVTWIYPPWHGTQVYGFKFDGVTCKKLRDDVEIYLGANNALSLRSDVAELFRRNQLGIDVDDNYRVVLFRLPDALSPSACRTYLDFSSIDPAIRPSDGFFRRHFRHCLMINFLGGDIRRDYEDRDWFGFFEEQGITSLSDVDLSDTIWQSVIGREMFRILSVEAEQLHASAAE